MSAAATLVNAASAASSRLRLDIEQLHGRQDNRVPAFDRLEAAVGRDLAERLVAELSEQDRRRLEAALSTEFADRITSLLAEERGETDEDGRRGSLVHRLIERRLRRPEKRVTRGSSERVPKRGTSRAQASTKTWVYPTSQFFLEWPFPAATLSFGARYHLGGAID